MLELHAWYFPVKSYERRYGRTDGRKPMKEIGHRMYKINFQFEKVEGILFPSLYNGPTAY
jgi:hypothetical protein